MEKNLQYPEFAQEKGIMGTVKLVFIIDENGKLADISVLNSPHSTLSEEAVRIVKTSGNWIPAKVFGKPIPMTGFQSITFQLQ